MTTSVTRFLAPDMSIVEVSTKYDAKPKEKVWRKRCTFPWVPWDIKPRQQQPQLPCISEKRESPCLSKDELCFFSKRISSSSEKPNQFAWIKKQKKEPLRLEEDNREKRREAKKKKGSKEIVRILEEACRQLMKEHGECC